MAEKKAKHSSEYGSGPITPSDLNPSVGNVTKGKFEPVETAGIKIRGTGAATKGVKARGPMA